MGLFDRINRILRSNVNAIVTAAEDPEKILNQTIEDMSEDLVQLRQAVATALASQKRMERQYEQAQRNTDEWQRRAELAIRSNNEDLAREALIRKKQFAETAQSFKRQVDDQNSQVTVLRTNLTKLESKISEAKTRKDMLIARARSAKASQQINEVIGKVNTTSSFAAFERMEEKVNTLESQSAAVAELTTDNLENQFLALEVGGSDVDSELAMLKASMLPSSEKPQAALGSGSTPISTPMPAEVDAELEALRREMSS